MQLVFVLEYQGTVLFQAPLAVSGVGRVVAGVIEKCSSAPLEASAC
jgi:hypothetical protein